MTFMQFTLLNMRASTMNAKPVTLLYAVSSLSTAALVDCSERYYPLTMLIQQVSSAQIYITNVHLLRNASCFEKQVVTTTKTYLVTEDSGAGNEYWQYINHHYFADYFTVIPVSTLIRGSGIGAVRKVLLYATQYLRSDTNYVFIADCADYTGEYKAKMLFEDALVYADPLENVLVLQGYICFEALFIAFTPLLEWISAIRPENVTEVVKDAFLTVTTLLNDAVDTDFWEVRNCFMDAFGISANMRKDGCINYSLEDYCTDILNALTKSTRFLVKKAKLYDCWFDFCCSAFAPCALGASLSNVDKSLILLSTPYALKFMEALQDAQNLQ